MVITAETLETLYESLSPSSTRSLLISIHELLLRRSPITLSKDAQKLTLVIPETQLDKNSEFITNLLNYCFQTSANLEVEVHIARKTGVEIESTLINRKILSNQPDVINDFYKNHPAFFERNKNFHLYFLVSLAEKKHFSLLNEYLSKLSEKQRYEILPNLIIELIATRSLNQITALLQTEEVKKLLNETYNTNYYLHFALKAGSLEDATLLASLLKPEEVNLNGLGQTVLHSCQNDLAYLDLALKVTPDINIQDKFGNTPLHLAAQADHLQKFAMLLYLHANDNKKNNRDQTCWDLCSNSSKGLYEYAIFKKEGVVLSTPPITFSQEGLTCGFFAVNQAASHLRKVNDQRLFSKPLLPALKRQTTPKSSQSLRSLRKSLGIEGVGGIFSVKQLLKVVDATECKGVICKIENEDQFVNAIKNALEANFPIIIPYSTSKDENPKASLEPKAKRAHWSMIVGYHPSDNTVLFAQDGKFIEEKISVLFNAFYNIPETFPGMDVVKKGKEWVPLKKKDSDSKETMRTDLMPAVSLEDFRRQLVIITPPGVEEKKITELEKNITSTTLHKM